MYISCTEVFETDLSKSGYRLTLVSDGKWRNHIHDMYIDMQSALICLYSW